MAGKQWGFGARAESFAAALEGEPGTGLPESDTRLLAVAGRLRAFPEPPAAMRAASRAALLGAAGIVAAELARAGSTAVHAAATSASVTASAGASAGSTTVAAGATTTGAAVSGAAVSTAGALGALGHLAAPFVAATAAAALAATGVGIAAHQSTPGQPFYQVKKAVEQVQLDLTDGPQAAAKARLGFAAARLSEIQQLTSQDASPLTQRRVAALLDDLWGNLNAARPALLRGGVGDQQALWRALDHTTAALNALAGQLPASLTGQVGTTLGLLTTTRGEVSALLGPLVPTNGTGGAPGSIPLPSVSASAHASSGASVGLPAPSGTPTPSTGGLGLPPVSVPPIVQLPDLDGLVDGLLTGILPPAMTPPPGANGGVVPPVTSVAGGLLCQLLHTC